MSFALDVLLSFVTTNATICLLVARRIGGMLGVFVVNWQSVRCRLRSSDQGGWEKKVFNSGFGNQYLESGRFVSISTGGRCHRREPGGGSGFPRVLQKQATSMILPAVT